MKNIKLPDPEAAEAGAGEVFHAAVKRVTGAKVAAIREALGRVR